MSKANFVSEMTDVVEVLAKSVVGYEDDFDWESLRDEVEDACRQLLELCAAGEDAAGDDKDDDEEDDGPEELRFCEDEDSNRNSFEDDEDLN